jgi:uncharacterized protein YhaN
MTPHILAALRQISQQLTALEERLETLEAKVDRPNMSLDLLMDEDESEDESDSETESSEGYQSAPASFSY